MFKLFDPVKEYVFYLDVSCKISKLQYNSLSFVDGLERDTDEDCAIYYPPLMFLLLPKDETFIFYSWFVINRDPQGFCHNKEFRFDHLFSG